MKLIFIHGRSQENRKEDELKKEWTDALNVGLQKSNLVFPPNATVELPYYGNLLPKLVNEENPRVSQFEARRGSEGDLSEAEQLDFYINLFEELSSEIDIPKEQKAALNTLIEKERDAQNAKVVLFLAAIFDKVPILRTFTLDILTKDVLMYISNTKVKNAINTFVETRFDTEPCVVVGHSLGSIVSYLILKNNPQYNVKKFITLGSPLGLSSIQDFIGQPRIPKCIDFKGSWFNAFDKRDIVALFPLDKNHFNIMPPIENKNDVDNSTDNRHGIEGYLSDAVVAKTIYNALVS